MILLSMFLLVISNVSAEDAIKTYPAPADETPSADYAVFVNGQPVFCYTSFRFDTESAQTIAGRPVSPVTFCYFDMNAPVDVEVHLLDGLTDAGVDTSSVVVRPLSNNIKPEIVDGVAKFTIENPCQLSFEPGGGILHPLHIFANPFEEDIPDPNDPNVMYFGPGSHEINEVDIKSGQTVYIAGGAVVHLKPFPVEKLKGEHSLYGLTLNWAPGMFSSNWQKDVTIRGRGMLCGRRALEQFQRGHLIRVQGIDNLLIEGIILRESSVWCLNVVNCNNVRVDNVKLVAHYVNSDGICIGGTTDAVVENCFAHNADDTFEVKVWIPQKNVTFRNCIAWSDLGGSFGLMHETGALAENINFENCTVIHATDDASVCPVVGLKLTGEGSVRNFRFENIVIEQVDSPNRPAIKVINNWDDWHFDYPVKPDSPYELAQPPVRENPSGSISDVLFKDIQILQAQNTDVVLIGETEKGPVDNIRFENVSINSELLVDGDARLKKNQWVTNVTVE